MNVCFRKKGPVLMAVDHGGAPMQLEVAGTLENLTNRGAWYAIIKVDATDLPMLMHIDTAARNHSGGNSPLRGDSLLVKVPCLRGRFQCKFLLDGAPATSGDMTAGARVVAGLVFGGVWTHGYTWKAKTLSVSK